MSLLVAPSFACKGQAPAPSPSAAQPSAAEPVAVETASPPDTIGVVAPGTGAGTGTASAPEPVDLGEPVAADTLPEGWPESMPLANATSVVRIEVPEPELIYIEATHVAPARDVLDWYVAHTADRGFLVLQRQQLGPSVRLRLARDRERWLVVVARRTTEEGMPETWLNIRRMRDEEPVGERIDGGANDTCEAELAPTSARPPTTCRLEVGPPLEEVPFSATSPDAAWNGSETALLYLDGRALTLVTIRDDGVHRGPTALLDIDLGDPDTAFPQLLAGSEGLWLVSWINGDPPERRVAPYDGSLGRTDRYLWLSQELRRLGEAAFAPIVYRRRFPELAAAWVETLNGQLAFRVAGLKPDADRVRRSGQFPIRGALTLGPHLVSDAETRLALLWGGEDGLWIRPIGTDGLPDGPQRRLEPGEPTSIQVAFGDDSYWVTWARGERGFWVRSSLEGCQSGARGFLRARPEGAWSHPLGPLVQVRRDGALELLRLGDTGDRSPSGVEAETLGRSHLAVEWSDFNPSDDGLRGVVRLPTGFHSASWACE